MMRSSPEFDPNVVYGRYGPDALGETTSGASAAAYLNADQRGDAGANGKPSLTIDEAAVQLTRDRVSWGDDWGDSVTVTFAFRASAPSSMPDDTSGFSRFSATQINATLLALQAWSDVANITFNRVDSGTGGSDGYSNSATILFGNYSSGADGAAAFAYYPYSYAYSAVDGDVWINSSLSYNANPQPFNYGQLVLIHEIGHAIGISHPADYNAGDDENITYSQHATYFEDSMQYTVMSYFYETYTGASYGSPYPATIMLDDIAAAQRLYGANMTTRTGDTVYGFNSNSDRPWFTATSSSTPLIFAVWDAGGNDTFDFSGYSSNARIELREGFFSNVGGLTGNVAVAKGAVIENAKGGHGADTIIGNGVANRLQGNAGNDTLTGLGGADVFVFTSGGGADVVTDFVIGTDRLDASAFGGYVSIVQSGADTVVNFSSTVSVRLTNINASNLTASSFIGIAPTAPASKIVNGTSASETLLGGEGDDFLYGFGGADRLDGKAGDDAMHGGGGDDTYIFDSAGDLAVEGPGEGSDKVYSSVSTTLSVNVEHLFLTGSAAIDGTGNGLGNRLYGNAADNTLTGGGGDDRLKAGAGADTMIGETGDDVYHVDSAADVVIENAGEGLDTVNSSVSLTLGANVERLSLIDSALNGVGNGLDNRLTGNALGNRLEGLGGDDILDALGGADTLLGGAGADKVFGGDGGDTITGGTGGDRLSGGAGADTFVYQGLADSTVAASDRIVDFDPLADVIDFSAIDANANLGGDQAFVLTSAFTGAGGEMVMGYYASSNTTSVTFDVDGDRVADFRLRIQGQLTDDGGFIL